MQITLADVRDALRADAVSLALGTLLIFSGLLAVALAVLARLRSAVPTYLGIFALMYGLRLLARTDIFRIAVGFDDAVWEYLAAVLTYVMPIPLILFARALEPGWRKLWNGVLIGLVVFATGAIAADALLRRPNAALTLNNLIVITLIVALLARFFRPGLRPSPDLRAFQVGTAAVSLTALADNLRGMGALGFPGPDVEPFGFSIAIACLGIVAARRIIGEARRLVAIDRELSIARDIQASILPQAMPQVPGLAVAARYRPMAAVAGDFYDFVEIDRQRLGILVADVSGHGVPAALIASMVKVALAAQRECADRPGEVLAGMNRTLHGRLGGRYVTAAYLFVDAAAGTMRYAAAGHPPLLRTGLQQHPAVQEVEQNGILLGFLQDAAYDDREEPLHVGDRLLLYTDGLIEAENGAGDFFGLDRVKTALSASNFPGDATIDAVLHAMDSWSGLPARDDLTLVLLHFNGMPSA